MRRFIDRLPVRDLVTLGEGDTPLVELPGQERLMLVKCEQRNPTGSFKDRIAAVAVAMAAERGLAGVVGTSSGNGGAAAAAYAAHAGLRAVLFALRSTPRAKLAQILACGARVHLVDDLGHDPDTTEQVAADVAAQAGRHGYVPFLTGARYSPEIMVGARTIAYELAEQCPDATHVYAPVGGGGLVASLWRGYRDLGPAVPRIVAVQPAGCPTLRAALDGRRGRLTAPSTTTISGLQVASLFDDDAPAAVRASGGHLVEVPDDAVLAAQRVLARRGILVEPAGATALAGALADVEAGRLGPADRAVLIATGAAWKDPASLDAIGTDVHDGADIDVALTEAGRTR